MEYASGLMFLIFTNDYRESKKSLETVEAIFNLVKLRYLEVKLQN